MPRSKVLYAILILALLLAACGPTVSLQNTTGFAVRAVITTVNGSSVVSPSPGESSSVEAAEGAYTVTAIPDQDWVSYAQTVRKLLNEQLANPDSLTGPQLLDVVKRLKDIAAKMKAFQDTAGAGATCRGMITQDSGGAATVGQAADGSLLVACN
jgi:hypothetical protein